MAYPLPYELLRALSMLLLACTLDAVHAQVISGTLDLPNRPSTILLYGTRGADHPVLDSAHLGPTGAFRFRARPFPTGFYQLGINDSDRVDIILDSREAALEVHFSGRPLQRNITVARSGENQRMWTFKRYSRAGQATIAAIRDQRAAASPRDTALLSRLDRMEADAKQQLDQALDSLVRIHPDGQFAFAVDMDRKLQAAVSAGPAAILGSFDLSDPRLLRSAAYTKALVYYLQSSPVVDENSFHRACDSLLRAAAGDTATWSYTRKHLIDLFTTYGPDEVAQYLVERYVIGPDALVAPEAAVLRAAAEQLRVASGAIAPDMILVRPGVVDTAHLRDVMKEHAYTTLFFYSSTCDHCHDQMPGLRQLVLDMPQEHFLVVGIALDATVEEFKETIALERINWPCYTELKGWGAQGAKDFNVKATPSFIVVDREGRIVAKPLDHEALRSFISARLP